MDKFPVMVLIFVQLVYLEHFEIVVWHFVWIVALVIILQRVLVHVWDVKRDDLVLLVDQTVLLVRQEPMQVSSLLRCLLTVKPVVLNQQQDHLIVMNATLENITTILDRWIALFVNRVNMRIKQEKKPVFVVLWAHIKTVLVSQVA